MYTTYHLKADELNEDFLQSVKTLFHGQNIEIIVSESISNKPETIGTKPRRAGALQGRIKIADDFNAPLADFAEYEQ